ncbi:hypothetical protein D3C72_1843610 [compost metagenome]
MVVGGGLVAIAVADHHAGYQAQQLRDVAGAAGFDQGAVEYRDAAGNCRRRLLQARSGQYFRHGVVVVEQVIAQHFASGQQCQQRQGE